MASPHDLVPADLSLQEADETYEAREARVLASLEAPHVKNLDQSSAHSYPKANEYWQRAYGGALPADRVKQIDSAQNIISRELTSKLRSILASLPTEEEKDSMLTWMEHNLIGVPGIRNSVMSIPRSWGYHANLDIPRTFGFKWPDEVPRPSPSVDYSVDVLPKPYLDVIIACTEAGLSKSVIYVPLDDAIQEWLVLLQGLKNGGITPENFGTTYSRRTLLSVDSKGNTHLFLQKSQLSASLSRLDGRNKQIGEQEDEEQFMDPFKGAHPLDPFTVAQIALALEGITNNGFIQWGKLEWPRVINLTDNRLQISRAVELELKELRKKSGKERIDGSRDEIADKIEKLFSTGGVIQVTSVSEANAALEVVMKKVRGTMETADSRADSAAERVRIAEEKSEKLENIVTDLRRRITASDAGVAQSDEAIAGLRKKLEASEAANRQLEAAGLTKKSGVEEAYRVLEEDLKSNKGLFGISARLAAYGKFLETVLKLFK